MNKESFQYSLEGVTKLKQWNWAACFLSPIWSIVHKLPLWTVLCFIPFVNFIAHIYLGLYGNRLAYPKSDYESIEDYMEVQKYWKVWTIRFLILLLISLIVAIFQ